MCTAVAEENGPRAKKTESIVAMFKKDPLTALGISPDAEMSSDVHMRKNEIVKDVENRSSTFKQWVTVQNLFLVSVIVTLTSESAVGL